MNRQAERLVDDLKHVANDAKDLVAVTRSDLTDKAKAAEAKLKTAIETAKESCEQLQKKAIEGAKAADRTIRRHPYESLGIVLIVGLVAGVVIGRGRD